MEDLARYVGYGEQLLLMLCFLGLYVFLLSTVYPRLCFTVTFYRDRLGDRGIRRFRFPEGRGVLYEPAFRYRKRLERYVLFSRNGGKYVKCRFASDVRRVAYDVVALDNRDRVLDVLAVSETVGEGMRYTKTVKLPPETAYVSVLPRRVDGERFPAEGPFDYPVWKRVLFLGLCVVTSVVLVLLLREPIELLLTELLSFTPLPKEIYLRNGVLAAVVFGGLYGAICAVYHRRRLKGGGN